MVLRSLCLCLLLFSLLLPCGPVLANGDGSPAPAAEIAESALPGLGELGPRSSALADFVVKSQEQLKQLADLEKLTGELAELNEQFGKSVAEMKPLGAPEDWYVDRLNHYLNRFAQHRQGLTGLQERLAKRQQAAEKIGRQLQQDREFWANWAAALKKQQVKLPKETLTLVDKQLQQLEKELKSTTGKLLQLQEKFTAVDRELLGKTDLLTQALGKLRQATFRRNAYSFFSPEFYRQFEGRLWTQVEEGLQAALKFDRQYLLENGWLLGLMVVLFLLCVGVLHHYRGMLQEAEAWRFVLRWPLATAVFVAVTACWFWFPAPPPLFRFCLMSAAVISATLLALPLLQNRRQVMMLVLAAGMILLTNGLRLIALPQPLFRVYISLLAVLLIPLLVLQVFFSKRLSEAGQGRLFRGLMRLATVVLAISAVGQVAGYMNFSTWLVQASFETGMVLLFARMAVLLISGGIELGNLVLVQSGQRFFKQYGSELSLRLKRLLRFLVYSFSLLYLLPVWRIFATVDEGWEFLGGLSFQLGELTISLHLIASALFAFYLSLQVSWVLQGISETQWFYRRKVDRGVRDAVKKLMHYSIVLIGFLLALSLLGLGVQNFVVLLGAFGVGIGFGLQDIVNNFLSGLILLFERPIKVGDFIVVNEEWGTVNKIGLRSTVVETIDHSEIIVPNSQLIAEKVTNWTLSSRVARLVVPVGVAYGSDVELVMQILSEVANEHPESVSEPAPSILFMRFGDSSLDFEIRVFVRDIAARFRIRSEILQQIDARFRAAGVEIPFPQRDLHLRSVAPGVFPAGGEGG